VSTSAYLSIHNMCLWMLETYGNSQQKDKYMPALIPMDLFASYCLTEPGSGSDARAMSTTAKKDGTDYVLNGSKMFISGGPSSGLYIVMAKTSEKDVSAFLVEKGKGIILGKN
jgi:isobutyryl-CoA dehydrogenase